LKSNLSNLVRRYRTARKRNADREVSFDGGSGADAIKDGLASSGSSPSGAAIRREEHEQLLLALRELSPRDRQVILWHSQDHCPWDELGRRLGMSPEAARKAWSRAVNRLREKLGEAHGS
jgi:RNA polymerase sigma-70 factor (ECF subfamily)